MLGTVFMLNKTAIGPNTIHRSATSLISPPRASVDSPLQTGSPITFIQNASQDSSPDLTADDVSASVTWRIPTLEDRAGESGCHPNDSLLSLCKLSSRLLHPGVEAFQTLHHSTSVLLWPNTGKRALQESIKLFELWRVQLTNLWRKSEFKLMESEDQCPLLRLGMLAGFGLASR